ncbi:MAG: hypothetical protein IKS27_01800, partial [Oscillospiraceae bacterium]|nr:hypothetical protein [Oscillospiraceae bacterium]
MKKRIISFLLILLLMAGLCAVTALAADGDPAPWAGSGTDGDPYKLPDITALTALKDSVNAGNSYAGVYFQMTGDIALPADWETIGFDGPDANGNPLWFCGNFDGGGHTVTVAEGGLPLFGHVSGSVIKNLKIYGSRIESNGLIHRLVMPSHGTLENITIKSGTKTLKAGLLGGLSEGQTKLTIGLTTMNDTWYISNCTAESGVVIGYNRDQDCIGSFCGRVNTAMTNCTSSAAVYGRERVGGLIGTKDNA